MTYSRSYAAVGAIIRDHSDGFLEALAGPIGASFNRASDVLSLRWSVDLDDHDNAHAVDFWSSLAFLVDNIALPCPLWNYFDSWSTIRAFFLYHGTGIRRISCLGIAIAAAIADRGLSLDRVTFFLTDATLSQRVQRTLAREARAFVDPSG